METIDILKKGILIAAVAVLVACGGGSSSSSEAPPTATITAENAGSLLAAMMGGVDAGSSTANVAGDGAGNQRSKNRAIGIGSSINRLTSNATTDHKGKSTSATAALVDENTTKDGPCGGTAVTTGTWDNEVFNVDLTVTYTDYCEDNDVLNGVIAVKGQRFADNSFNWTLAFTELNYKNDVDSFTLNGQYAAEGSNTHFSMTINYEFKDNNAGKVYKAENLNVTVEEDSSQTFITGTISGKVTHPDYGSYVISTNPALVIYHTIDYPTSGTVRIDGAGGSYASAEYHADGTYTLTIFDGVTTTVKTCQSDTDICS